MATLGICVFRNTHATDTLLFRKGSGGADMVKARPTGGLAFFEAAANDIFVSSSSGTIKMERFLLEA